MTNGGVGDKKSPGSLFCVGGNEPKGRLEGDSESEWNGWGWLSCPCGLGGGMAMTVRKEGRKKEEKKKNEEGQK